VYPVNPLQASRYRQRHGVSGAKSDGGDSHMLADAKIYRSQPGMGAILGARVLGDSSCSPPHQGLPSGA
jgi:hypothetical protein